jgi:hypothetical protein
MVEAVDRFFASGRAAAAPAGADALAASDRTGANAANRPATASAPPVEPAKP